MKKYSIILLSVFLAAFASQALAQEVDKHLNEAKSAYAAGQLDAARFALQQAMNEVDLAIGKEILKVLPAKMGQCQVVAAEDNVSFGAGGYAGLYLNRTYRADEQNHIEVQIIGDSPLLAGVNAILSLPLIGAGDPNQKRIRVGNYRALMQKSTDSEGIVSWDVQVPFGSSLMTVQFRNNADEKTATDLANTIPVEQVARLLQ